MNEHDLVLLEDGRRGTIVHLYPDGKNAEVELQNNKLVTVALDTLKEYIEGRECCGKKMTLAPSGTVFECLVCGGWEYSSS